MKKEEEDEAGVYRWWDAEKPNDDDSVKWSTLENNGVLFPPPYQPLPSNARMKYKGISSSKTANYSSIDIFG